MTRFIDQPNECVVRPPGAIGALGDADDHLRLAVLLGQAAIDRGDTSAAARGCVDEPTWSERLDHLREVVESRALAGLVFHDIDALWQGEVSGPAAWADSSFRRERGAVFEAVVAGAACGGWRLLRPAPSAAVSRQLDAAHLRPSLPDSSLPGVSPELRPLARALLARGLLDRYGLDDLVEAAASCGDAPDVDLIGRTDEQLSGLARDAVLRLALLRIEQPYNGVIGPFPLTGGATAPGDAELDVRALPRAAVDELVEWGLLHVEGGRARMPRAVRRYFSRRAWATGDIEPIAEHAWFARSDDGATHPVERAIERHHHAVESEDWDTALATGRYYLQDLRQLATRIGRRRGRGNQVRAARMFAHITRYDPRDAYAWEYYGYNLAQVDPATPVVEHCYAEACRLEPDNPLYRGRLLGWRGAQGADIVDEARQQIAEYGVGSVAASWFAHQILTGLQRGRRDAQLDRLAQTFGPDRIERWLDKQTARG